MDFDSFPVLVNQLEDDCSRNGIEFDDVDAVDKLIGSVSTNNIGDAEFIGGNIQFSNNNNQNRQHQEILDCDYDFSDAGNMSLTFPSDETEESCTSSENKYGPQHQECEFYVTVLHKLASELQFEHWFINI